MIGLTFLRCGTASEESLFCLCRLDDAHRERFFRLLIPYCVVRNIEGKDVAKRVVCISFAVDAVVAVTVAIAFVEVDKGLWCKLIVIAALSTTKDTSEILIPCIKSLMKVERDILLGPISACSKYVVSLILLAYCCFFSVDLRFVCHRNCERRTLFFDESLFVIR